MHQFPVSSKLHFCPLASTLPAPGAPIHVFQVQPEQVRLIDVECDWKVVPFPPYTADCQNTLVEKNMFRSISMDREINFQKTKSGESSRKMEKFLPKVRSKRSLLCSKVFRQVVLMPAGFYSPTQPPKHHTVRPLNTKRNIRGEWWTIGRWKPPVC